MKKAAFLFTLLLSFYFLLRLWFFWMHIQDQDALNIAKAFLMGLRSDYTFLFFLNLPVWIYLLFIESLTSSLLFKRITFLFFLIANVFFFLAGFIDLHYYQFTQRRITIDLFYIINDSLSASIGFLKEYLLTGIIFIATMFLFYFLSRRIFFSIKPGSLQNRRWLLNIFFLLIAFIAARGINRQPFLPVTLFFYLPQHLQPLASNAGFSLSYSIMKKQSLLKETIFFSEGELNELFPIKQIFSNGDSLQKKNIIVFILESFTKQLTDSGSGFKAYTPFLDSIKQQGLFAINSNTNSFESNKGIVAILGSLPTFTPEPYYYSVYASNEMKGIGHLLADEGYTSSFFMGANFDHFGFAKWSKMIGIQKYVSMEDYKRPEHHDGAWGISDHYFLPFAAQKIKQQRQPFFSVVYNLSSHYPFIIPKTIRNRFTLPAQNPQQNAATYVDFSIRAFFESIRNESWYKQSIFVFVSDHCTFYNIDKAGPVDYTEIPIFFHIPGAAYHAIEKPVQQLDILPTLLDLLNYPKPFTSFGKSMLDTSKHYTVFKKNSQYFIRDADYMLNLSSDLLNASELYDIKNDKSLSYNRIDDKTLQAKKREMERYLKAFIQRYNRTIIRNEWMAEK